MQVTLSLDDQVVAKARQVAALRGRSMDQFIRDSLEDLARPGDVQSVLNQLDALWSGTTVRSQGPWSRDELHDRQ